MELALKTKKTALYCALSALVAGVSPSYAQESASQSVSRSPLEEVVVTATKREQTLQDAPLAITVTDGATIDKAKIQDIIDLQAVVPSLRVEQRQNSTAAIFYIRGFGNGANNPGIEPSVAVFVDGVYRSRATAAIADLPKVDRIEVLKGPQSTLFGKNASAGVISIVSAKPSFETEGYAELGVGNYDQRLVKGYLTGPILDDSLAYSIGGTYNKRDGYVENVSGGDDLNDRDRYSVRGELLWQPTDDAEVRFIVDQDYFDENCCYTASAIAGPAAIPIELLGGVLAAPEEPFDYEAAVDFEPENETKNTGGAIIVNYDISSPLTLTSITSYRENETKLRTDFDYTSADLVTAGNDNKAEQFTQELRLASSFDGPFNFLVGGFYYQEDVDLLIDTSYRSQFRDWVGIIAGAPGIQSQLEAQLGIPEGTFHRAGDGIEDRFKQDNESYSIFGEITYDITDSLTAILGVAYVKDKKDASYSQLNTDVFSNTNLGPGFADLQFLPQATGFPNVAEDGKSNDDNVDYTARFTYAVNDEINVYASYATGYKPTSWNYGNTSAPTEEALAIIYPNGDGRPFNQTVGLRFAEPEESEVYELGLKAAFDSAYVNIAVFDQKIENFQATVFNGNSLVLSNAEEQSVKGAELDMTWYLFDNWSVIGAVTWLDPKYDSFTNSSEGDISGETPANISEWNASIALNYDYNFGEVDGFARLQWYYESKADLREGGDLNQENLDLDVVGYREREVNSFNASIGARFGRYDVTVWGKNLLDDEYLTGAVPTVWGGFGGWPNEPRTYGVTARLNF